MKIGVKTFNNPDYLKKFEDKVDFFEIMAVETNNYDFIKKLKLPIIIHSQHRKFGVNIADKTKFDSNLKSINFAIKIANTAKAKKIILHPGDLENKNCSIENSIEFINNLNDKRIIIENIPQKGKTKRLCQTPKETKEFLKITNCGFCFDINHAIWTALTLNQDYTEIIKEFVKLKPIHYHFGGQIIKNNSTPQEKREHLALKDSDYDLKEVLKLIPKDAEITLETTTNPEKSLDDINIMRKLMKELNIN